MKKLLNINTVDELAVYLGISKYRLETLANNLYKHCKRIPALDKHGKPRDFIEPKEALLKLQKRINKNLLSDLSLPESIIGSRKNGSIKKNAELHAGQRVIGNLDIKDFFPSIGRRRVKCLFITLGCSYVVSEILVDLTTYKGRLPLGFPTSSAIANLILLNMEKRFKRLCNIHGMRFSFYVDDITISGNQRVEKLKKLFCKIIRQEGFEVNLDKMDFCNKSKRQLITGLVVNSGKPNVPKKYKKELRLLIHNCIKYGPSTQTVKNVGKLQESLIGKIGYISSVNPDQGQRFLRKFNEINWAK